MGTNKKPSQNTTKSIKIGDSYKEGTSFPPVCSSILSEYILWSFDKTNLCLPPSLPPLFQQKEQTIICDYIKDESNEHLLWSSSC